MKTRVAGSLGVIRSAAPVDDDIAALWSRIETELDANQRVIVESLAAKRALRRGLDVECATDILWTLNHPGVLAAARTRARLGARRVGTVVRGHVVRPAPALAAVADR